MKQCTKCKLTKPIDGFRRHKSKRHTLGYAHHSWCQECEKENRERWDKTDQGRESQKKSSREYREKYPEKRKLLNKTIHQRRFVNDLEYRLQKYEATRKWKKGNREHLNKSEREWRKRNPGKKAEYCNRRRAMKVNLSEDFTLEDWNIVLGVFGKQCFKCNDPKITMDHYRPLSKGNSLSLDNTIPLCKSCNSSKGSKDPEDFFTKKEITQIESCLAEIN